MHTLRVASLCLALLASNTSGAMERAFDKVFPASAGGTFTIETDTGDVQITGTSKRDVVIHAVQSGARGSVEKFNITAEGSERNVTVRGRRAQGWWWDLSWLFGGGLQVRYTIEVPQDYTVRLRTSGGDMHLRTLDGKVDAHTSGGDVNIETLGGEVAVRTSGGDITATKLRGRSALHTSGGDIEINTAQGSVEARTSGGDIRLMDIAGKMVARTSGGDIRVDAAATTASEGIELRTSGGDITVSVPRNYAATLDASTVGGDVDCDLPLTTESSTETRRSRNSLRGSINGGGALLYAHTAGGDIQIRAK